MDDATFNGKLVQIKQEIEQVGSKRKMFTKDDANLFHKAECLAKLQRIEDAEEACQAKIIEFIYNLNSTDAGDASKIAILRNLSDEIKQRVKQNANEVTIKMAELLRSTPLSEVENATIDLKKKEYEDRKAFHAKKEADEKKRVLKKT